MVRIVLIVLVAGLGLAGCEEFRKSRLAKECVEARQGEFRHPDTVEVKDSNLQPDSITVTVTAQNSFGVPLRNEITCPVRDGVIDRHAVTMDTVNRVLERSKRMRREQEQQTSCELENWTFRSFAETMTQIDGETSCRRGMILIRTFDEAGNYLGNTNGVIQGNSFTAYIDHPTPKRLRIKYEIQAD